MELQILDSKKPISISDEVFTKEFREGLVHQVVNAYLAGGRAGTKAQKTRAEVRGTTKKFKKQKGGGARHGDYRAPIFVGGGVTFAARPRSFLQKVNKKMYRGAVASILAELLRQDRLKIVENDFSVAAPKTKLLVSKIEEMQTGRTLIVSENASENLYRAARNLPYVAVVDVAAMDPVSLVHADHVLLTVEAVKKIEEWLS